MTSKSVLSEMTPEDRAVFGFARVRNAAFEAVQNLWRRRKNAGLTQLELAARIDMDPARLSKHLSGPGNWTLRTFGELVEALDGEAEIVVHGIEDPLPLRGNYHAYAGYEVPAIPAESKTTQGALSKPQLYVTTQSASFR